MSEQRFPTPQPIALEVTLSGGDIRVSTTDGDESTVALEGDAKQLDAMRVELMGNRLVIQQRRKSLLGIFERFDAPLNVRATVPHGSRVEVVTAAADSTLEGTFADVQMKSASGSLLVSGQIEGDANVETVSGDIRLPYVTGALTARSVSADVAAEAVGGSAVVKSVSGNLRLGSLRQGSTTVQSVSGEVDLGIAAGTSIDVDAVSASGELTSEIPLSPAPGDEAGPTVVIRGRTVSGHIRLHRAA
jgi:Putative adhesin